jgi:two-component system, sensor histidine kinase PdtaS
MKSWVRTNTGQIESGWNLSHPTLFAVAQVLHDLPSWARYALATILVLLTFALRQLIVQDAPGYHFIFFVPSVILSSLFLAQGAGIWAVLVSAALIKAVLLSPSHGMGFSRQEDFWALVVFLGTGLLTVLTSEALHDAFFRLATANKGLAEANARIAASEQEKDLLLQELTHRFKNDLANLTAILRLQARSVTDPFARTELMEASERVQIMGRLHQHLTPSAEASVVDVGRFISELCEDWRASMIGLRPIVLGVDVEQDEMPFSQAIMLALIINELVTNSLKYAFPEGRAGKIDILLSTVGTEHVLMVRDDGIGNAAPFPDSTGLGQRLVHAMTKQLNGKYHVERSETGRICVIRFPAASVSPTGIPTPTRTSFVRVPEQSEERVC